MPIKMSNSKSKLKFFLKWVFKNIKCQSSKIIKKYIFLK